MLMVCSARRREVCSFRVRPAAQVNSRHVALVNLMNLVSARPWYSNTACAFVSPTEPTGPRIERGTSWVQASGAGAAQGVPTFRVVGFASMKRPSTASPAFHAQKAGVQRSIDADLATRHAGHLQGQRPPENPHLAAQRLAKQEAGLSQQQRRLQQWTRANAGARLFICPSSSERSDVCQWKHLHAISKHALGTPHMIACGSAHGTQDDCKWYCAHVCLCVSTSYSCRGATKDCLRSPLVALRRSERTAAAAERARGVDRSPCGPSTVSSISRAARPRQGQRGQPRRLHWHTDVAVAGWQPAQPGRGGGAGSASQVRIMPPGKGA